MKTIINFPSQGVKDEAIDAFSEEFGYPGDKGDKAAKEAFFTKQIGLLIKERITNRRARVAAQEAKQKAIKGTHDLEIG